MFRGVGYVWHNGGLVRGVGEQLGKIESTYHTPSPNDHRDDQSVFLLFR